MMHTHTLDGLSIGCTYVDGKERNIIDTPEVAELVVQQAFVFSATSGCAFDLLVYISFFAAIRS